MAPVNIAPSSRKSHLFSILALVLAFAIIQATISGTGLSQRADEFVLLEKLLNETSCQHNTCGKTCSCEPNCLQFGDCCHSFALQYLSSGEPIPQAENRWQCTPMPGEKDTSLYMISSCPVHWEDNQVSLRCARSKTIQSYTHILDIPVFSKYSGTLYANIHCAACNNDSTTLAPTQLNVICQQMTPECTRHLQTARYVPGELQWQEGAITIFGTISEFQSARKCQQYTDKCNSSNSTQESIEEKSYRKLCHLYKSPIFLPPKDIQGSQGLYKNVHCAACNGLPVNLSECHHQLIDTRYPIIPLVSPFYHPSFSIIIDFDGGGGVGEESVCETGQMYDTVQGVCIDYFCGKNYEMDEYGKCEKKTDLSNITNGGLNDSCTKIALSPWEYSYLNDSTIRVNRTNDENVFETDSFEETDNGTVLICSPDTITAYIDKFSATQGLLSFICLTISLICLAVHIIVYVIVDKLRNLPGKNLLSLSCSIFVAQLLFLSAINITKSHQLCVAIGAIIHFSYLASFFWMNVMAFDMCRKFTSKSAQRSLPGQQLHIFVRYSLYAWMLPCFLVSAALILDATDAIPNLSPRYAQPYCWINSRMSLTIFLALPLLVLLVENIICFTMIAYTIKNVTVEASAAVNASTASKRTRYFLYVKLAFILGLTWILGFVAAWANLEAFWYLYIIFNSLQGAFIFFAFTFKRRVLYMIMGNISKEFNMGRSRKSTNPETTTTRLRTTTNDHSSH